MLILNFHCNLDFGTQRRENGKRINNEDKENGILSGTKYKHYHQLQSERANTILTRPLYFSTPAAEFC